MILKKFGWFNISWAAFLGSVFSIHPWKLEKFESRLQSNICNTICQHLATLNLLCIERYIIYSKTIQICFQFFCKYTDRQRRIQAGREVVRPCFPLLGICGWGVVVRPITSAMNSIQPVYPISWYPILHMCFFFVKSFVWGCEGALLLVFE